MLDRLKTILSNSHSDPVVDVEGEMVPVKIRRNPRARRISMRADAVKREIRITMPNYTPTNVAMDFVAQKHQWIAARLHLGTWKSATTRLHAWKKRNATTKC